MPGGRRYRLLPPRPSNFTEWSKELILNAKGRAKEQSSKRCAAAGVKACAEAPKCRATKGARRRGIQCMLPTPEGGVAKPPTERGWPETPSENPHRSQAQSHRSCCLAPCGRSQQNLSFAQDAAVQGTRQGTKPKEGEELNPRDRRGSKPTCKRVVGPEPPIPLLGTLHVVRPGREPKWAQPKSKAKRQGVAGGHSCKWQRHSPEDTQTQCAKREAEEDGEQG